MRAMIGLFALLAATQAARAAQAPADLFSTDKTAYCKRYADNAASLYERALDCNKSGALWSPNPKYHFDHCMAAGREIDVSSLYRIRSEALYWCKPKTCPQSGRI